MASPAVDGRWRWGLTAVLLGGLLVATNPGERDFEAFAGDYLAELASDVSLSGVQQVADALASHVARLRTSRVVADITASLQGAQEVSRLLHQFAVGNEHVPQENVLAALRTEG